MSDASHRTARPLDQRVLAGLGLAYALPALAYDLGRPRLGFRKGWIELIDDFAPWLYLPAPFLGLVGIATRSPSLVGLAAMLCARFAARWGRRFLRVAPADAPADLTVMTFNTLAWTRDGTDIMRAIERVDPDLVTLQELGPRPMAQLILGLEARLPYQVVHATPRSSSTATLSRFPILKAETFALSPLGAHWSQWLEIDAPGGRLTLFNIHTKIPRLRRSRWGLGPFVVPASFHAERRLREVHRLCAMLDATDGPLLAMGDFNMTERSEDHALIARRLVDAYREVGRGLGHTFPAWLTFPPGLPLPFPVLRLDHVWHSEHFRAVSARVGPSAGSDHHSVIVRLKRTPPRPLPAGEGL